MTVVRKYPTAYTDGVGWTNPENVCNAGEPDATCAYFAHVEVCDHTIVVSGFGFAIPAGSTINSVKIGMQAELTNKLNLAAQLYLLVVWNRLGLSSRADANVSQQYGCAYCSESYTLAPLTITLADLNDENFSAVIHGTSTYNNGWTWRVYCDTVWIEVDYTEPAAAVKTHGDGITFVTS